MVSFKGNAMPILAWDLLDEKTQSNIVKSIIENGNYATIIKPYWLTPSLKGMAKLKFLGEKFQPTLEESGAKKRPPESTPD